MRDARSGGGKSKPRLISEHGAGQHANKRPRTIAAQLSIRPAYANRAQQRLTHAMKVQEAKANHAIKMGLVPRGDLFSRTMTDLQDAALYSIPGTAIAARHPIRAAKNVYHGFGQDIHHPLRHPGYTLLDLGAGLSGGAGAVSRGAAALSALKVGEGFGGAIARRSAEGGSLMHAPHPGVATLKVGDKTLEKPLSRNAAYRQVQKARTRRLQHQLDRGASLEKGKGPTGFYERHGAESHVGNEIRTERRMEQAHNKGDLLHVRRLGRKLSRGEHAAMRVVAIEGNTALKSPAATIARHIATHEKFVAAGEDAAAHTSHIRDLKLAQVALEKKSPRFMNALAATRDLSNHFEQESIARDFLKPATAQLRKKEIANIYGGHAGEGSFYFHAGPSKSKGQAGRFYNPRPGEAGIGVPSPGRYVPEFKQQFTGKSIAKGRMPLNIPKAVSEASGRRIVLHSAHDMYDTLKKASHDTRVSRYDIPIRSTKGISADLKRYFRTMEENVHATPDEIHRMTAHEVERLKQELQAAEHHNAPLGAKIEGVRWVDSRMVKDLGETNLRGPLEKVADAVNNPIRAATLYFRPAYILNALGNASMLAFEGTHAVRPMWEGFRSKSLYGSRNTAHIDALMGEGRALGQVVHTGPLRQAPEKLAEAWNMVTDIHARRGAFLSEAKRAGFRTPEDVNRLIHDKALAARRNEVTRRARSIIGDYENLTPVEKNTIRRLIYFYPWLKVATKWTGHTLTEHPIKAAIVAQEGKIESAHAKRIFGMLPEWARLSGLVPIGGAHVKQGEKLIDTINPSSVNTPSTVVQTAAAAANTARGVVGLKQKGTSGLQDLGTPALQSIISAGGQADGQNRTGLMGAVQSTPFYAAGKRLGYFGGPSKTYPEQGRGPAFGPLGAGGFYPRETSLTALNTAGLKEARTAMSPHDRTNYDYKQFHSELGAAMKSSGEQQIPKSVRGRLALRYERAASRSRIGGKITSQQAFVSDIDVIAKHRWMNPQEAAQAKAWAASAPKDEVSTALRYLTTHYFDRDHLLSASVKYLNENGHGDLKLPRLP